MKNKTKRKRFFRLVTVLCAAIFVLGSQMTVFAATDLVGRGTVGGVSNPASSTVTAGTGSSTAATAQAAVQKANTSGTTTGTGATVTTGTATTSRVTTNVQTGVMNRLYPFIIGIGAALAVFALFFHLQMNQIRYGKSEKYYKELLDFICACKL